MIIILIGIKELDCRPGFTMDFRVLSLNRLLAVRPSNNHRLVVGDCRMIYKSYFIKI